MKLNPIQSDDSYMNDKYFKWFHGGCQSPQDKDPSFIQCSLCHRRTPNLKLAVIQGRDYLVCEDHSELEKE